MELVRNYRDLSVIILCGLVVTATGVVITRHTALVLLILVGIVGIAALYFYRRWVRSLFARVDPTASIRGNQEAMSLQMRLPRVLYFTAISLSGILIVRPALGFTLSDWLFFVTLGATFLGLLVTKDTGHGFLPTSLIVGAGLFALGSAISSAVSPLPEQSMLSMAKFLYLSVLWFWLGTMLLRTPKHLIIALSCWIFAMGLSGGASLVQAAGFGDFWSTSAQYGRFTGGGDHPNDLGAQGAIALVPAVALVSIVNRKVLHTVFIITLLGFIIVGIVLSGSVTGLLTSGFGLSFWVVGRARFNLKFIFAAVACIFVFVGVLNVQANLGGNSPLERLQANTDRSNQYCTSCSRAHTTTLALEEIYEQPLVGRGLDPIGSQTSDGYQVHVMLLKAWYESGFLGVLGIAVILLSVASAAIQNISRSRHHHEATIALALLIAFLAFMVIGLSQPLLFQRYAWFPAAFIVAQRAQQLNARSSLRSSRNITGGAPEAVIQPNYRRGAIPIS